MSTRRVLAIAIALSVAAGGAASDRALAQDSVVVLGDPQEVGLEGVWQVDIELDSVAGAARQRVSGRIVLRPAPRRADQAGGATLIYPGTFDIKLDDLGILLRTNVALAWNAGRGDVRVQLNPSVGAGSMLLRGRVEAGVVSGTWTYEGERQQMTGRFSMKRG